MSVARSVPPVAAFGHTDYRLFQGANFFSTIAIQMQSVAVGWQVYDITHRAIDLGYVGLVQFLPAVGLSLFTGDTADRFDRRRILIATHTSTALCSAFLLFATVNERSTRVWPIYLILFLFGTARAFARPASQSFMPHLVPAKHFGNAVAWGSLVWQVAYIVGPALGGAIYGWSKGAPPVYAACTALSLASAILVFGIQTKTAQVESTTKGWERLLAGFRYVLEKRLIFGAISLDAFAVFLGGVLALLPIYARDILHTGPWGLGLLRSAPAAGASLMAIALAYRPFRRHAGMIMIACVAMFGAATIVFGLSTQIWVSLLALVVIGASDMVSVVFRQTLVQLTTPAPMRGRVSAVNVVFTGTSNELGEFESGMTAAWLGAVHAVVLGGLGTLVVVAIWAFFFPELRRIQRLDGRGE